MAVDGRIPAVLLSMLIVLAPFDVAVPASGWGTLAIRPLMIVAAFVSLLAIALAPPPKGVLIASAIALAAIWSATFASEFPAQSGAASARLTVAVLVFVAACGTFTTTRALAVLGLGVLASSAVAAFVGLATHSAGGDLGFTSSLLGDISVSNGERRLTRPFSHANVAAMFLGPVVALLGVQAGDAALTIGRRALLAAAAGISAIALSLTLSSGGLFASLVGLVLGGIWAQSTGTTKPSVVVPFALSAYLVGARFLNGAWDRRLTFDPGDGVLARDRPMTRPEIWEQAWEAFTSSPIFGVGPGLFGRFSATNTDAGLVPAPHAHSLPLEVLATGGVVCGVIVIALTAALARNVRPASTAEAGLAAAILAIGVHAFVDYGLVFTSTGILISLLVGAALGMGEQSPVTEESAAANIREHA